VQEISTQLAQLQLCVLVYRLIIITMLAGYYHPRRRTRLRPKFGSGTVLSFVTTLPSLLEKCRPRHATFLARVTNPMQHGWQFPWSFKALQQTTAL